MNDNLNSIEVRIMNDLYEKDYKKNLEIGISIMTLPLIENENDLKIKEAGFYLERLKRLNYIEYKEKSISRAGRDDNKYRNNIIMIWWDDIHITYKGKLFIEEARKSPKERIFASIKNFVKDIGKEIRKRIISHIATFILGIFFAYLYYIFFIK